MNKARAIRAKLGQPHSAVDDLLPAKPKGMHWRTYSGLCRNLKKLDDEVSEKLALSLQKFRY